MRYDYNRFARLDTTIFIIGPEGRETFAEHWQRENYPFVGLPDPENRVANRYEQEVNLDKLGRLPALVLVDKSGAIQYQHYGESIRDVASNEELVALLRRLNGDENSNGSR